MSLGPPYPPCYPAAQPALAQAKRPVIVWDVVVTILIWCLNVAVLGIAAFATIFLLAFIDYCPPESCSVDGAFGGAALGALLAAVVMIAGLVLGIIRLVRRRIAWWIAAIALVLSCAGWATGLVLAMNAVGYFR